jgi:hypothetical protein
MRTRIVNIRYIRRVVVAVTVAAAAIGLTAAIANAAGPAIDLDGMGTYVVEDDGSVTVRGSITGQPVAGPFVGTLAADDGSLPEPGDCEPATATLRAEGVKRRFVELTADGDVCGQWTDETYRATHVFTGRYVLTASFPRKRSIDGFYEIRLADNGVAGVRAIDT